MENVQVFQESEQFHRLPKEVQASFNKEFDDLISKLSTAGLTAYFLCDELRSGMIRAYAETHEFQTITPEGRKNGGAYHGSCYIFPSVSLCLPSYTHIVIHHVKDAVEFVISILLEYIQFITKIPLKVSNIKYQRLSIFLKENS